jgi:hypothetical protein
VSRRSLPIKLTSERRTPHESSVEVDGSQVTVGAERALWALISVLTIAWLILAGTYSLGVLGVSASNHVCYRASPSDRVEVSWVPLGYSCRHVGPTYRYGDDLEPGEVRVDGPGPITAALQVFLVGFPVLAWIATGRMEEPIRRRRELAHAGAVGGFGLTAVGVTALVVGAPGLAVFLLAIGSPLATAAVIYVHRTKGHLQDETPIRAERTRSTGVRSAVGSHQGRHLSSEAAAAASRGCRCSRSGAAG